MGFILDTIGFIAFVTIIVVGTCALLVGVGAATVASSVSFDATGTVQTSSAMVDTSTESILAITNGINGRADISYTSTINAYTTGTSLVSNAGTIQASSGVVALTWHQGGETCAGQTCVVEPTTYANVNAGSSITLRGAGSIRSSGLTNTDLVVYDVDALGIGSLSQYGNAISMADVIDDNTCIGLSNYNYRESNRINGVFNYTSRFTFTP